MKPYYADEQVTLYCGDMRELLPAVIARHGEPDLTLTDPPYGETSLTWDRWPDGWPALIPGRSMWCFGSMRMFLDHRDDFAGWKLSQDIVWEKQQSATFVPDRFARVHEHVAHWYRGAWGDVHRDTPTEEHYGRRHAFRSDFQQTAAVHGERGKRGTYTDDGTRALRSVLRVNNLRHGNQAGINPTEKPSGIVEPLVLYGCPPGGLVLDVFAGGCSTLVAARNRGRRAVGIELREEQCAKAVEWRLSQAPLPFGEAS